MAVPKGLKPFKKGQSGNPAGKPKGSKTKLSEAFWSDLHGAWETYGVAAVEKMAVEEPSKFVQVVASVMPKEVKVDVFDGMSNEQLASELREALDGLRTLGVDASGFRDFPPDQVEGTKH